MRRRIDIHADRVTAETLRTRFRYCFMAEEGSDYPPILDLRPLAAGQELSIAGRGGAIALTPFRVRHGKTDALEDIVAGFAITASGQPSF